MKYYIYAVVAGFIALGTWTYYNALNKVNLLSEELSDARQLLTSSQSVISSLREEALKQSEMEAQLYTQLNQAEDRVQQLKVLLSKHDLEFLALNKPELIERRMNDATRKIFSNLERSTGSTE